MSRNFITDSLALRTIDTHRIIYLFIAIASFFITEFGRFVYRPFIYSNNINDLGIADSIGNLGGIVVQIFFMLAILNSPKEKGIRVIGFLVIGYIVYEVAQPYLPKGVFDWKDVYGTAIGGLFSAVIFFLIQKLIHNRILYKIDFK